MLHTDKYNSGLPQNIIIIISSFYSSVEHRDRVKVCHLVLFAAKAFTSAQLFLFGFGSFNTVIRHVVLVCPLFLVPQGFHSSTKYNTCKSITTTVFTQTQEELKSKMTESPVFNGFSRIF
jgi:hypothetical protein